MAVTSVEAATVPDVGILEAVVLEVIALDAVVPEVLVPCEVESELSDDASWPVLPLGWVLEEDWVSLPGRNMMISKIMRRIPNATKIPV